MDQLAELMAREHIRQLAQRYALAVDGKDVDTVATLFAPHYDAGPHGVGPEGIRHFFDVALRDFHCSMHLVANHVIDVDDDDHAHGVVYCRAHHHVLDPEHWFDLALAYWDTYERIDGTWVFARRRTRSWYRQEIGHPTHGSERVVGATDTPGLGRGRQMPEAFDAFAAFWARPPHDGSAPPAI